MGTPEPFGTRLVVSLAMGVAGFVVGTFGTHELHMSWSVAIPAGIVAFVLLALIGWRFPEAFFKNRE